MELIESILMVLADLLHGDEKGCRCAINWQTLPSRFFVSKSSKVAQFKEGSTKSITKARWISMNSRGCLWRRGRRCAKSGPKTYEGVRPNSYGWRKVGKSFAYFTNNVSFGPFHLVTPLVRYRPFTRSLPYTHHDQVSSWLFLRIL